MSSFENFKTCEHCGKQYIPRKWWQKYCTTFCRNAAYYARNSVPDFLSPPAGPSEAQKAEWAQRKNTSKIDEMIEQADKRAETVLTEKTPTYEDWLNKGDKS